MKTGNQLRPISFRICAGVSRGYGKQPVEKNKAELNVCNCCSVRAAGECFSDKYQEM